MAPTRTIAAFEDAAHTERARDAAAQIVGEHAVRLDHPDDVRAAKLAEGQSEMRRASPLISMPVMTGNTVKVSLLGGVLGAVLGTILMLPVTYLFMSSSFGAHLALSAAIGITGGGVVGWLAGGYLGATVDTKPLAAERGHVLAVQADDRTVTDALLAEDPIRIERVDESGQLVETVAARDFNTQQLTRQLGRAYAGHDEPDEIVESDQAR